MNSTTELLKLQLKESINNGINSLLSSFQQDRWKGFPTLAGESDVWVTGFIVSHIQELCNQHPKILDAQNFIMTSQNDTHGWSYSKAVPSDADSTAWCIIALSKGNELSQKHLDQSKEFLWSHYTGTGISTYKSDSGIAQFISAPNDEAIAGWTSAHPDVTVAALLAHPSDTHALEVFNWLKGLKNDNGLIKSYWWRSPLYTTTLMLRSMQKSTVAISEEYANRLIKQLEIMQLDSGGFALDDNSGLDPFSTALALEALVRLKKYGSEEFVHSCAKALIDSQSNHGDWMGNFILRIPAPYILDPNMVVAYNNPDGGGNSLIKDEGGLFATALSCYALGLYKKEFFDSLSNLPSV